MLGVKAPYTESTTKEDLIAIKSLDLAAICLVVAYRKQATKLVSQIETKRKNFQPENEK